MLSNLLTWVGVFTAAASGFASGIGREGLAALAMDVYDGMVGFACWLVTSFADMATYAFVTVLRSMPGGWVEQSTVDVLTGRLYEVDAWFPVVDVLNVTQVFISFLFVYVAVRIVLRLIPGIV